jgi:uncharacterized damage-inducible protein DinB
MPERTQRVIAPLPAASPEVGKWLWALEETRARTKRMIAGVTQEGLDALPDGFDNAIGTLLYHIALIEADYLCIDVMGLDDYLPELKAIFPFPVRTDDDRLAVVSGVALDEHLRRLDLVRKRLLAHFATMTAEDATRARALPEWGYDISPEWTLFHLSQHEGEHRGEIGSLLTVLR